ncbi:MAG: IS21 family transposase [Solirubrobacteraceae bacterium]
MRFVEGLGIREIRRRTGLHRETIRKALGSSAPPSYSRPSRGSKLDPFKGQVHELLREDPEIEGQRIRELLIESGFDGGKTIVDDYVREVRPFFRDQRTFQRTVYRLGDVMQFDLWQPKREVAVGYSQTRKGYVVVGVLGYSRFGAGALVFSKEAPDVLWGMRRCVWRTGALAKRLVVDREGCLHAGGGRPTEEFASFCGQLSIGWRILDPGDCQAKGVSERLQGFMETSFEPGRSFANELDFQDQLDRWFSERANVRLHRTLRERPVDRLVRERESMRPLPEPGPDLDRRIVIRVPPQPYVHVDRNDYSLDPRLVGRRVEVRVSQREVIAVALDTGELAAKHRRVFAAGQELTDPAHQALLERLRLARYSSKPASGEDVEVRDLSVYDRLAA